MTATTTHSLDIRAVDPRALRENPNNPRTVATPGEDEQLRASMAAVGLIQMPTAIDRGDRLEIMAGARRVHAAIALGWTEIPVDVRQPDEANDPMRSLSENVVRAQMNPVDIWRAAETLASPPHNWSCAAIAGAFALKERFVAQFRLMAKLHPPMLKHMETGDIPDTKQISVIAAAPADEQAQVWKAHKPRKGEQVHWHGIANALAKRRIPFAAARFGPGLAEAYGIVWLDDLFGPAGQDNRYTTDLDAFLGAQSEWLSNNLPKRGEIAKLTEQGEPILPKGAARTWSDKLRPGERAACYVDPRTGNVETVHYRVPEPKAAPGGAAEERDDPDREGSPPVRARPALTQKGVVMTGEIRTAALAAAIASQNPDDLTLLALVTLAMTASNVAIRSGTGDRDANGEVFAALTEGDVLATDPAVVRAMAKRMLSATLSCRDGDTNSGIAAVVAGRALGADAFLPNMATEAFLSTVAKDPLRAMAAAAGVTVLPTGKATRAEMAKHFGGAVWHYPGALFQITDELREAEKRRRHPAPSTGREDGPEADAGTAEDEDFPDGTTAQGREKQLAGATG